MVDTTPKPPPRSHLVQQDIRLARESRDGVTQVSARVECARRGCTMEVEQCACCPHFVRIEVHEAGYLLLCHEEREPEAPEADPSPAERRRAHT